MLGIDLGSNTLRAVLMDKDLNSLKEEEFIIGAAKNLNHKGQISDEAIQRLKEALRILEQKGYKLKEANAAATAAFRKASNTETIFEELKKEFGIVFKTIDAKTEAKLSILGMKNALNKLGFKQENLAFCDLGGASCELSFGENFKSFDFGIITFFEKEKKPLQTKKELDFHKFFKKRAYLFKKIKDKKLRLNFLLKEKNLKKLAFAAFDEIKEAKRHLRAFKGKIMVLNSGVPTTLLAMKKGISYEAYEAKLINGKKLHVNDFLNFGIKLYQMSEENAKIWVGEKRKNYITAGCFLLFALFEKQRLVVVDEGLREGLCIAKMKGIDF